MPRRSFCTIAIGLAGDEPPTEFRLFVPGWNDSENGRFLFDEEAAKLVMAAYEKWGVDLSIDLEHQMFDGIAPDPTARDARGWFRLAVRDGSLFAVDVRWTDDGAERLRAKRQRYISPAFEVDRETKRITKVINAAICSIPATHQTPALVAASATSGNEPNGVRAIIRNGATMDPDIIKRAIAAIVAGDNEGAMKVLEDLLVSVATGGAPEEAPADTSEELANDSSPPEGEEDEEAENAALSLMMRATGASSVVGLASKFTKLLSLEAEYDKFEKAKASFELGQRKENAKKLIALGAETPATSGMAKGSLCKRLLDEPLEEQTDRVKQLLASRGGKLPVVPPADRSSDHGLTDRQLKICKETGCDPAVFARLNRTNGR